MQLFLRIFGLLTAAAWFGTALAGLLGAAPATDSDAMRRLLGSNFPYFSVAAGHILTHKLILVQACCAALLCLHLFMEWLYLGAVARRPRWLLLGGAICLLAVDGLALQPRLKSTHLTAHAVNASPELKTHAAHSFRTWQTVTNLMNWCLTVGLAIQVWRLANPPEPTRFVSSMKFRS